ncbi:hypothetical protein CNMCM6457_009128 [Aspergillus fumigatiaffinis]|nr:hypothetical protein CNMCM6457_009128 [Aspergillus fumigatiaffinis]
MSVRSINVNKEDSQNLDLIIRNGLAGGVAGCVVSLLRSPWYESTIADARVLQAKRFVAPLERVKILFQTSHSHFVHHSTHWNGLFKAARDIQKTYGISALFKGHSASLVRIFPYASIHFLAYEQIRAVMAVSSETGTPLRRFLCGSIAGATSTFITYPLDLIRTRLAFETGCGYYSSWLGICRKIYHEEGRGSS